MVLAGSLLGAAEKMLEKGMHPTIIAESFTKAATKAVEYLTEISTPIDLKDRASLLRAATTSLNSKVSKQPHSMMTGILIVDLDCVAILVNPSAYCRFCCD